MTDRKESITVIRQEIREIIGPRQAKLVLIAYASSEGSGEPAHPRSLARTFAARSYKQWIKRNLQTENQIPGPSEWLGMRSWNLSWRNARRHKFAWRGSIGNLIVDLLSGPQGELSLFTGWSNGQQSLLLLKWRTDKISHSDRQDFKLGQFIVKLQHIYEAI